MIYVLQIYFKNSCSMTLDVLLNGHHAAKLVVSPGSAQFLEATSDIIGRVKCKREHFLILSAQVLSFKG